MPAWGWALIVIGAAAILAFAAYRVWRTRTLRQRFGPEYDRTLEEAGSRRGAESPAACSGSGTPSRTQAAPSGRPVPVTAICA